MALLVYLVLPNHPGLSGVAKPLAAEAVGSAAQTLAGLEASTGHGSGQVGLASDDLAGPPRNNDHLAASHVVLLSFDTRPVPALSTAVAGNRAVAAHLTPSLSALQRLRC
ncbi:hypothetical protein [Actinacidiphila glaucinigra]|uniref:hypothetical protein n=1 Tax=Actinacidiphila glaucinigra TaxID=235986 RepID=UPI0035DA6651